MTKKEVKIIDLLLDIYEHCIDEDGYFNINCVSGLNQRLKRRMVWLGNLALMKQEDLKEKDILELEGRIDEENQMILYDNLGEDQTADAKFEKSNHRYIYAAASLLNPLSNESVNRYVHKISCQ